MQITSSSDPQIDHENTSIVHAAPSTLAQEELVTLYDVHDSSNETPGGYLVTMGVEHISAIDTIGVSTVYAFHYYETYTMTSADSVFTTTETSVPGLFFCTCPRSS